MQRIIIVEYNKTIDVFNEEGNRIRYMDMDVKKLKVNGLCNSAVDHVDSVYNGQLSNNIGKCDRYFNNVQVQEVKQLQDCGHYDDITVVETEVLVTEWNNKGQITVYDRDLNFVHHIFIND